MTREELAERLYGLFRPDGEWDVEALNRLDAATWQAWIAARLRGEDPCVRYGRDEYPDLAADLFVRLSQDAGKLGFRPAALCEGAARFLATLDPSAEVDPALLRNAIELVGQLRAWHEASLTTLRDWIGGRKLLQRQDWPMELHRAALFALGALQERGDPEDQPLFREWLEPWGDGPKEHRGVFIPAAFCGFVFSSEHVPRAPLQELLKAHSKGRAEGWPFPIAAAILSLWVERDQREVRDELWGAIHTMPNAREYWESVRRIGQRARYYVPRWEEMELASIPSANVLPARASGWVAALCITEPLPRSA